MAYWFRVLALFVVIGICAVSLFVMYIEAHQPTHSDWVLMNISTWHCLDDGGSNISDVNGAWYVCNYNAAEEQNRLIQQIESRDNAECRTLCAKYNETYCAAQEPIFNNSFTHCLCSVTSICNAVCENSTTSNWNCHYSNMTVRWNVM